MPNYVHIKKIRLRREKSNSSYNKKKGVCVCERERDLLVWVNSSFRVLLLKGEERGERNQRERNRKEERDEKERLNLS